MTVKYLDDAHALALKAWHTHFPIGYLDPDDKFVEVIREALSTIDPEAKPQEPNEDAYDLVDKLPLRPEQSSALDESQRDFCAALITAHVEKKSDAIRREERTRIMRLVRETVDGEPQSDITGLEFKYYMQGVLDAVKEVLLILSTVPAPVMHDLDHKVADCVQKNFNELIATESILEVKE